MAEMIVGLSLEFGAMNRSRPIHRSFTHTQAAQPYFGNFCIVFLIESSDVLTAAGWDQTACHHRHPICAYFLKRFELSILNIYMSTEPLTVSTYRPWSSKTPGHQAPHSLCSLLHHGMPASPPILCLSIDTSGDKTETDW
jgi:hypothetical protein